MLRLRVCLLGWLARGERLPDHRHNVLQRCRSDSVLDLEFWSQFCGAGLLTPRGSGTNGYVQRNLSHVTRVPYMAPQRKDDDPNFLKPQMRRTSRELIEHEHKRKVESELLVIAERLKAEGSVLAHT